MGFDNSCSRNGTITQASESGGVIKEFMLICLFYKINRDMFIERLLLLALSCGIFIQVSFHRGFLH